jgi:hypothetical protein
MRRPVKSNTTAKTCFNLAAFNLEANDAPIGAKKTVKGAIQTKLIKLTKPNVPAGASVGVCAEIIIIITAGNAISNPIAEAVPTALCIG